MTEDVRLSTSSVSKAYILWSKFIYHVMRDDLLQLYAYTWSLDQSDNWRKLDKLRRECKSLYSSESKARIEVLASISNFGSELLAYVELRRNTVTVTFAAQKDDISVVGRALLWLQEIYPKIDPPTRTEVKMQFWTNSPTGANATSRTIAVPPWNTIDRNYAQDTSLALTHLMNGFQPAHGGQLLLWHGKPGTGKTFALRALSLSWRDWCKVECVVDPEAFFGDANYMMQVLLDTEHYDDAEEGDAPDTASRDKWRLLILEDAGELLAEDARQYTGQGLSRMLNLADGLIGQGMKALILVTTNEPLRTLHPAVARPGRCASEIEFKTFTPEEADTWLEDHNVEPVVSKTQTLAQLYGQIEEFQGAQGNVQEKIGFRQG